MNHFCVSISEFTLLFSAAHNSFGEKKTPKILKQHPQKQEKGERNFNESRMHVMRIQDIAKKTCNSLGCSCNLFVRTHFVYILMCLYFSCDHNRNVHGACVDLYTSCLCFIRVDLNEVMSKFFRGFEA